MAVEEEENGEDDQWTVWGKLVSEWTNHKPVHIRVIISFNLASRGVALELDFVNCFRCLTYIFVDTNTNNNFLPPSPIQGHGS